MIIILLLFIATLYFFFAEKRGETLFGLMAIGLNCFGFVDPSELPVKTTDFVLFIAVLSAVVGGVKIDIISA